MRKVILFLIKIYQRFMSPIKNNFSLMFGYHETQCKYYPTCSEYARQAVEKYGVIRGSLLSIKRILRCNPFSKGGYDPVK